MAMTLQQEAAEKIALLPEAGVRAVLALVDDLLGKAQASVQPVVNVDADKKLEAFQNILEYSEKFPFPADFDFDKAREEAIIDKYGRFD